MKIIFLMAGLCITSAMGENNTADDRLPLALLGPTIVEKPQNVDYDVEVISKFTRENVTAPNGASLAEYIVNRTLAQRLKINDAFKAKYNMSVVDFISQNLSLSINDFAAKWQHLTITDLYEALFTPVPEYLAARIRDSIYKKKDWTYMSIICTRSRSKIVPIIEAYPGLFGVTMSIDLNDQKNGPIITGTQALQDLISNDTMRPDNGTDKRMVEQQMAFIPGNHVACSTEVKDDFYKWMVSASFDQIRLVVSTCQKKPDEVLNKLREKCAKGGLQEVYKRIVRYAMNPYAYFAEEMRQGIEKNEFHFNSNIILMISRCEDDLKDILDAYKNIYHEDLAQKAVDPNIIDNRLSYSPGELYYAIIKGNNN